MIIRAFPFYVKMKDGGFMSCFISCGATGLDGGCMSCLMCCGSTGGRRGGQQSRDGRARQSFTAMIQSIIAIMLVRHEDAWGMHNKATAVHCLEKSSALSVHCTRTRVLSAAFLCHKTVTVERIKRAPEQATCPECHHQHRHLLANWKRQQAAQPTPALSFCRLSTPSPCRTKAQHSARNGAQDSQQWLDDVCKAHSI